MPWNSIFELCASTHSPGSIAVDQLDFDAPRHVFAGQSFGHRLAKQRAVSRLDEIRDLAPDQLLGFEADQARGGLVRQQDLFVVNDDDFGQRAREIREQSVAALDLLVALAERVEQPIDRLRELPGIRDRSAPSAGGRPTHRATLPASRR